MAISATTPRTGRTLAQPVFARAAGTFLGFLADSLDAIFALRIETWAIMFSISLLGGALGFQYFGGMEPCELCLKQRWVHGIAVGVAMMGMSAAPSSIRRAGSLFILSAALACCAAVAGFHVGVEQHWWGSSCSVHIQTGLSVEEILKAISRAPVAKCDEIAWQMLGLSMAGWNTILSALAAWLAFSRAGVTARGVRLSKRLRGAMPADVALPHFRRMRAPR